jgi:hypothetical protein
MEDIEFEAFACWLKSLPAYPAWEALLPLVERLKTELLQASRSTCEPESQRLHKNIRSECKSLYSALCQRRSMADSIVGDQRQETLVAHEAAHLLHSMASATGDTAPPLGLAQVQSPPDRLEEQSSTSQQRTAANTYDSLHAREDEANGAGLGGHALSREQRNDNIITDTAPSDVLPTAARSNPADALTCLQSTLDQRTGKYNLQQQGKPFFRFATHEF